MKRIDIIGDNYLKEVRIKRIACRSIVIDDDKILMSYESKKDRWMIPGGQIEENETSEKCAIRETSEETGYLISVSDCKLEIHEFYEDWEYVNRYFIGKVIGKSELNLTSCEIQNGMEPRWVSIKEIKDIFSSYKEYEKVDEIRFGMYMRENIALKEILG